MRVIPRWLEMRYKTDDRRGNQEETMSAGEKCGWTDGSAGDVSRRRILHAGLAAAAGAAGKTSGLFAQNEGWRNQAGDRFGEKTPNQQIVRSCRSHSNDEDRS